MPCRCSAPKDARPTNSRRIWPACPVGVRCPTFERWNARSTKSNKGIGTPGKRRLGATPAGRRRTGMPLLGSRTRHPLSQGRRLGRRSTIDRSGAALSRRGQMKKTFLVKRLLALGNASFRGQPRRHRRLAPAKSAAVSCARPRGSLPRLAGCGPAAIPWSSPRLPRQQPSP